MNTITRFPRYESYSTAKAGIELGVDLLCRVVGRRKAVRAAQFAVNRARLDGFGFDIRTDGESALQGWALGLIPRGRRIRVLDVGACVGNWSRSLLEAAQRRGRVGEIDLHAFEPSISAFEKLERAFGRKAVALHRMAVSDEEGDAMLHTTIPGRGLNSLHEIPGWHNAPTSTHETVKKTTIDAYARQAGLDSIDIIKVDVEGHDLSVLNGACGMLRNGRIGVLQFEYNHCWIYARKFLRDAFTLLTPLGYRLGKLTPRGIVFFPHWDQELESFLQAQYVACTEDVAERLPRVEWWNLRSAGTRQRSRELPNASEPGG